MHETSIAHNIYEICRETLRKKGPGQLEGVRVAVGELSGVEPELLQFAWEAITSDGPDRYSTLEIEWHPALQFCNACGEGKPRSEGSWIHLCPDCLQPLRVDGGDELEVLNITFVREGG